MSDRDVTVVLWLAQICLTVFPAWYLYLQHQQAKRSEYRERSALPFAAGLFIWTIVGVVNIVAVTYFPFVPNSSEFPSIHEVLQALFSTINTLLLTIGVVRLDNFPRLPLIGYLSRRSNRFWVVVATVLVLLQIIMSQVGSVKVFDMCVGLVAIVPMTIGLGVTFIKYDMGKVLTGAIIGALWLLEGVLIYVMWWPANSEVEELFLAAIRVTSKVAFMIVLVMLAAAWGRYYTSSTIEELKKGRLPERIRLLIEIIPSKNTDVVRRRAYHTIISYWPDSPVLLHAIKTSGSSSKEVLAGLTNGQMIAALVGNGVLDLSLTYVGDSITSDLTNALIKEEASNGQKQPMAS